MTEKKEKKAVAIPTSNSDLLEQGLESNLDSPEAVAKRRAKALKKEEGGEEESKED